MLCPKWIRKASLSTVSIQSDACRAVSIVELIGKAGTSFGLGINGGMDKGTPPVVSFLKAGSIAHRSDGLQVGDWLIAINGIRIVNLKHDEILTLLRNATDSVSLTVEYDLNDPCFAKSPNTFSKTIDIVLTTESGSLGFTLRGGAYGPDPEKSRKITITAIRPGGPSDREGRIRVGDRILGINGIDVCTATLSTAVNLLKTASSKDICLTLEYDVSILESVKNANGPLLVEIDKQPGVELGLTLRMVENGSKRGIIVERVTPASIADRCGALHVGDELLSVGQTTLEYSTTLPEVYQLLKNAGSGHVCLEVMPYSQLKERRPSAYAEMADQLYLANRGMQRDDSSTKIIQHRGIGNNGLDNNNNNKHATKSSVSASISSVPCGQVCHSEVMEVVLNGWSRGGYGLILHRNQNFVPEPSRSPLFVSYIERGSPADKSGVLQIGDRVLAINEWCTANGTAEEANYIIRHATGPLTLTVEFDVIVKLAKRGQYLGIVVHGSTSGHKGESVIVRDIRTGSVAHRCGSIQTEDQLLSIDNIPLDTCTIEEAVRLLQKSSDIVKLRVKKNPSAFDEFEPTSNTVIYTVELSRKGGPLGITIAGTDDQADPIVISQIGPGGIAEKTGAIHVGDRILAINGQSLNGKRVSEAMQMLTQAGDTVTLKIARFAVDHSRYAHSHLTNICLDRPMTNFQDHFLNRDAPDKLGTPVQSIDSAVESLEDSPLIESQHPSTSSNRNSQNSNSKSSSISGNGPPDVQFVEDLSLQLHKTLSTIKTGSLASTSQGSRSENSSAASNAPTEEDHYAQLGGDGCPCQSHSHNNACNEDWFRVLEALETVGENEMMKKLEESILAGTVPMTCGGANNVEHARPSTPKPPPKPPLNPPFPLTNTILKHPFSRTSMSDAQRTMIMSNSMASSAAARDILSSSLIGSCLSFSPLTNGGCQQQSPRPLSVSTILSAYENIPFITSPIIAPGCSSVSSIAMSNANSSIGTPSTVTTTSINAALLTASQRSSSSPSSIQLSGTVTPSSFDKDAATPSFGGRLRSPSPLTVAGGVGGGVSMMPQPPPPPQPIPLEIHRVTLYKDLMYNDFGFSVSDGVQDKGVYINKIRTGGPADMFGNVRPYDRILQVNETSLQDLDCLLAVPLLAAAGDKIDLLLCRDPTVAARQPESIEEEDEEERLTPEQTQV